MVECVGLENRSAARYRGFESHPLYLLCLWSSEAGQKRSKVSVGDLDFSSSRRERSERSQAEMRGFAANPTSFDSATVSALCEWWRCIVPKRGSGSGQHLRGSHRICELRHFLPDQRYENRGKGRRFWIRYSLRNRHRGRLFFF